MLVDSFLAILFLTQTDDFAKAIAFAWRPFFANIENGLIFRILGFFQEEFFLRRIRIVLYKSESDPLLSMKVVILQRL